MPELPGGKRSIDGLGLEFDGSTGAVFPPEGGGGDLSSGNGKPVTALGGLVRDPSGWNGRLPRPAAFLLALYAPPAANISQAIPSGPNIRLPQ